MTSDGSGFREPYASSLRLPGIASSQTCFSATWGVASGLPTETAHEQLY